MSHKCPAPGCEKLVATSQLACRTHWFKIPKLLRDEVWQTYDNGRGLGSPAHSVAIAEACATLREPE